ncbi:ABC transporter ATP-binding protein [Tepidimicrobium xylanilyticum]|uniref:Branched-chain amino acid transport system ATP-binding protein n=1 Tax=Tepidimicrobium xylanilyticum TaxID=1123352 RepID=A0A1H2TB30_9FIRM|nr:ABC transporter ATP-binding protein [Tepidimicrobium xylanilyticum]SDW41143.1 branched-chain amino acid transport system ATP-binding protein [Tepidimicrobium xylanilyticum]
MAVLRVTNLSKSFGGIQAIKNISLNIKNKEIVGIIGQNGAGKTTFFNLLTGIYSPSSGEIEFNLDVKIGSKDLKPYKIAKYGISRTFQNIRLFKNMTVLDNVLLGCHSNLNYSLFTTLFRFPSYYKVEREATEKAMKLLEEFDLADKKDELAKNLSYGEQRRLEIVRALATEPKILLLDEPAAGMNPNETNNLTNLIKWIRGTYNLTIILIEHDMSLVMEVCDRIFVFDHGNLIASGLPEEIKANKKVIEAYLGEEVKEC